VKKIIKKIANKIIGPFATRVGYRIPVVQEFQVDNNALYSKQNLLHTFYNLLLKANFNPKHIIDVGANHGTWTREMIQFFPTATYSLFEPQHWMKASISDLLSSNADINFYAMGAGKKAGNLKFTLLERDDSCNFLMSSSEAKEKGYEQIEVPVITLNEFISTNNLLVPDLIKIDAEGLDLEVLEGASDFFGKTEIFLVEAGIVNKGFQNSVVSVTEFMDKKGYRLFEITDLNRPFTNQVLWLVELAFVKKGGIIDCYNWM
jgi:FkbM family methyltransferase